MNLTRNFIDFFVSRGKDVGLRHLRIASPVILTLAATLLALGAYIGTVFQHDNPEVKLHQRLAERTRESQASEFLSTNLEINTVRRYQGHGK